MADSENFQSCLQTVVDLRSKTANAIKAASDGTHARHGAEMEGKEKKFLSELKLTMDVVNSQIKELETKANMTQPSINSLPLGNSVYLSLDAAPESIKIYQDLAKSYQWYDKTRDYATGASNLVSQNSLSRSYGKITKNRDNRRRAPNTSHIASTKVVDNAIAQISLKFNDMQFRVSRLNGSQLKAIVHITLGRILKATLILKGLVIEWVVVKGYNEEGNGDSEAEIWKESDHLVFRKITENANAAMLNFNSPIYPEFSLKSFITYLHSFDTLFTDKCRKCGYHLRNNLPPTWREFKTLEPFHEDCR